MVRLTPPEVAVTVSVVVPGGVNGVPPPPIGDPPFPQEVHSTTNSIGNARLIQTRCRLTAVAKLASMAKVTTHGSQGSPPCGPGGGPSIERAVVVTVTVTIASVVPSSVTEEGATVQVAAVGAPLQLNDTFPEKPSGERVRS